MSRESQRLDEIQLVMKEKDAMVKLGQELWELSEPEKIEELALGKKVLEFVKHLSNIAGFCDRPTQAVIQYLVNPLTAVALGPNELFAKTHLRLLIPQAIGIQVDFTKRPFRVLGLDVKAFGAQLKGIAKR